MEIKFCDLVAAYNEQREEINAAVQKVLENGNFILGKEVEIFEKEFAEYSGYKYAVGVANGTDALELTLRRPWGKEGSYAIIPANTFIADAFAIQAAGFKIKLVDVDEKTFLMREDQVEELIYDQLRDADEQYHAVIEVGLFGQLPSDKISMDCEKNNIWYIYDGSQAHGADMSKWFGRFFRACWSMYPAKNCGAGGDAGIITTNDESEYERLLQIRNYGSSKKYLHDIYGRNSRMDTLQAAILIQKLKKLDEWNDRRIAAAKKYSELLDGIGDIITPITEQGRKHVFHLFVIKTHFRDKLQEFLKENGIPTQIHYPVPIHKQKCYPELNKLSFPVTEKLAKTILSLPMHPHLPTEQIEFICDTIKKFFSQTNFYGERKHSTAIPFDV